MFLLSHATRGAFNLVPILFTSCWRRCAGSGCRTLLQDRFALFRATQTCFGLSLGCVEARAA
eukprot:1845775-Lingulodinium_polyedra.AAC.1